MVAAEELRRKYHVEVSGGYYEFRCILRLVRECIGYQIFPAKPIRWESPPGRRHLLQRTWSWRRVAVLHKNNKESASDDTCGNACKLLEKRSRIGPDWFSNAPIKNRRLSPGATAARPGPRDLEARRLLGRARYPHVQQRPPTTSTHNSSRRSSWTHGAQFLEAQKQEAFRCYKQVSSP